MPNILPPPYNGYTPVSTAAPSPLMEPTWPPQYDVGEANYPESSWTARARAALFSRAHYATAQSYEYASQYPTYMTWDYASPFLYAHPALTPYPYVLQG
jgi:hypothetical protein